MDHIIIKRQFSIIARLLIKQGQVNSSAHDCADFHFRIFKGAMLLFSYNVISYQISIIRNIHVFKNCTVILEHFSSAIS